MRSVYDYFDANPARFVRQKSIMKYVWYILMLVAIAVAVKPDFLSYIPADVLAKVPADILANTLIIRIAFGVLAFILFLTGFLTDGGVKNKETGGTIVMRHYYKFSDSENFQAITEAFKNDDFAFVASCPEDGGQSFCLEIYEDTKAKIFFLGLGFLFDGPEDFEFQFKELKKSESPENYKLIKKMI
ncbi:hypothetical protein KGV55_03940 [Candidatus Gracilibacteria bacterium]|nr:hypothetical protein [Candidatus Gracilibacteria bacterium]